MPNLLVLCLVGVAAQLIGGSLGMGHGVISSSLLLAAGLAPAVTSATVHLAEIGTTLSSGVAHWRFGNIDWPLVARLAIPGAVGAFAGALALSSISTEAGAPLMSAILLTLGAYILVRFTFRGAPKGQLGKPISSRFLGPLGVVAGFVSSTGGGGWGPIATPALLASGRLEPRKVVGCVQTGAFLISVSSTAGFLLAIGFAQIPFAVVAVLMVAGFLMAPVAAWLVRHIPGRILGSLVGGLIVLANARTILSTEWLHIPAATRPVTYVLIALAWIGAVAWSLRAHLADRAGAQAEAEKWTGDEQAERSALGEERARPPA